MPVDSSSEAESLAHWLERLVEQLEPHIGGYRFSEDDHFAFMCACFLARQFAHGQSVLDLREKLDSELIARSMLEGLCQLLWAASEAPKRAERWRAYSLIHDWRLLQQKESAGEVVDPQFKQGLLQRLTDYESLFLTRRAKQAKKEGAQLPSDPFQKNWYGGGTIQQLFEAVKGQLLYEMPYSLFSAWQHWSLGSIERTLERNGNHIQFSAAEPSAVGLAVAVQCLLQTAQVANAPLGLGLEDQLQEFQSRYIAECSAKEGQNGG